jgi:hypothetical protein
LFPQVSNTEDRFYDDSDIKLVNNVNPTGPQWWFGAGHGTAMLSKISGNNCGVAKAANSIVVKCNSPVQPECYLKALTDVYGDIMDPNNGFDLSDPKVVILFALYWQPGQLTRLMSVNEINVVSALQFASPSLGRGEKDRRKYPINKC